VNENRGGLQVTCVFPQDAFRKVVFVKKVRRWTKSKDGDCVSDSVIGHIHKYTHIHTYIHTIHTYICIHTYIHTHIHTHIHTYIRTYIHTIVFTWIKAHAGNYGNGLADKLAKEAARKDDISFNRIPKSEIAQHVRDQNIAK